MTSPHSDPIEPCNIILFFRIDCLTRGTSEFSAVLSLNETTVTIVEFCAAFKARRTCVCLRRDIEAEMFRNLTLI